MNKKIKATDINYFNTYMEKVERHESLENGVKVYTKLRTINQFIKKVLNTKFNCSISTKKNEEEQIRTYKIRFDSGLIINITSVLKDYMIMFHTCEYDIKISKENNEIKYFFNSSKEVQRYDVEEFLTIIKSLEDETIEQYILEKQNIVDEVEKFENSLRDML